MAHLECASVVPETWVDEVEVGDPDEHGVRAKEQVVFGVDGIVKDRWNLVSQINALGSCTHLCIPEMYSLHQASEPRTRRTHTMHERQMSEGISCLLRAGRGCKRYRLSRIAGDREGGRAIG